MVNDSIQLDRMSAMVTSVDESNIFEIAWWGAWCYMASRFDSGFGYTFVSGPPLGHGLSAVYTSNPSL